jgi:hypothetical protein
MFTYFARFHEKFVLPIYPIVIFSYSKPKREAISQYVVDFPDFKVLEFNYQVVQLNRLNWRDFLNQPNPVASALMAKMNIAEKERAKSGMSALVNYFKVKSCKNTINFRIY